MMRLFYTPALIIVLFQTIESTATVCNEKTLFYDDLNCKPIYANDGDICPEYFDCTEFDNRPQGKCHLKGIYYDGGDDIPSSITRPNCYEACKCIGFNGNMEISCAAVECPEWDGTPPSPGCKYKYDIEYCCAVGEVCPDKEDLVTCKIENTSYLEGSRYFSETREETCVCVKNEYDEGESKCRRNACLVQLYYQKQFENYCAPVYYSKFNSCPVEMYCSKETKKVKGNPQISEKSNLQCKLGQQRLNKGDNFTEIQSIGGRPSKLYCECAIPPFVSCYRDYEKL